MALEWLEDRIALSGSPLDMAAPLTFNTLNAARVSSFLSSPSEVDLYAAPLQAGDTIDIAVNARRAGGGLASLLRVFNAQGVGLALDNREGGDPHLRFQAATPGVYFIGVSSTPNSNYDATVNSNGAGETTGLYTLDVSLSPIGPLMPDMTGSSFRLGVDMAAAGERIPVTFTVENRGGADPGNFQVQVLAGRDLFDGSAQVLRTLQRGDLVAAANGRDFLSPVDFSVVLPADFVVGPAVVGLRIIPDLNVPDAGAVDKLGVHRGADFEPITIVHLVPAGMMNLSQVDAGLRTEANGTLMSASQEDVYSFTLSADTGGGELTAEVAAGAGTLIPRLSLLGPSGDVLIQSDSGGIVQYLQPGQYSLSVSAQAGTGAYRLTTAFNQTLPLLAPLPAGTVTRSVAAGDFNGDGIMDLAAANFLDGSVSILLGYGDGTYQTQRVVSVGPGPASVTIADVNGDGRPDLLTPNKFNAAVSVLLGNGDGTFGPESEFDVGLRPGGVAVADLNGDGKPDLAVSNYRTANVSVLLGNGDGTFQPQQTFDTGAGPGKVEAADVNGDGIPDLVTPNYSGANVSVLLGRGDGTFDPQRTFATGRTPYSVAIADLNGDGKPDLAVSDYVDNDVSVLLGNGDGTFAPRQNFATGTEPYSVAAVDVNGDGIRDLVTANFGDNSVTVLLGQGNGSFLPASMFPAGKNPRIAAVSDLNGDGHPDIATANVGDNSVSVLLGRGDGTFQAQQAAPAPAPGPRPFSIAIADLNGDGRNDMVAANKADNSVSVLLRNGDGSFQTKETFPTGPNPNSVAIADVNGDGKPDLVTANYTDSSVSVLLGNGDGTFDAPRSFAAGNTVYAVTVADVNGDGRPDIIVANKGDTNVGVLLGNGDGSFQPQRTFAAGRGVNAVTVGDVNGDNKLDIVAANFGDATVSVLFGNGDGSFQPQLAFGVGSQPSMAKIADVNGDGKPDIIAANYGDSSVSVLLGDGAGSFQARQDFAAGANPQGLDLGDFNGDMRLDVATADFGNGSIGLLLNNGNGMFGPPQTFPAGSGTSALAVGDVDGDGKLDIAATNRNDGNIALLTGDGLGAVQLQAKFGLGLNRYSAAVADVNGDGKPDIIKTNLRQNAVSVQLGNGAGTFEQGATLPVGVRPTSAAVADLNGDGRLDIAATNSGGDSVSVLLGNGDGTFLAQQSFAVGRSPRAVVMADVNGDGGPDLAVANYNDATVSILLGRGDGSVMPQRAFAIGQRPYALAVADINGDGRPDVVVANAAGDTVSVLLGDGAGSFAAQQTFATGRQPFALAVLDVNSDANPDIVTANAADNSLSILLGDGHGAFVPGETPTTGMHPSSLAAVDINGDGRLDLVTANNSDDNASILLGSGDGSFQPQQLLATSLSPVLTVAADVNGDGRPDLVTVGNHDNTTGIVLNRGLGAFQSASAATDVELRDKPFLVDLDRDHIPDSIVLDRSGRILFRKGLADATGSFAPPVVLNPGRPARDLAIVNTGAGLAVAAADARFDPVLSVNQFVFTVSLYRIGQDDTISRSTAFAMTALPARLTAADLTGDGRDDLMAANALDNNITIAIQTAPSQFAPPMTMTTGPAPSDITVADLNQDGRPDVAVSDQASGDVTVLLNDAMHSFQKSLRFRASTEPGGLGVSSGSPVVNSLSQSVSLIAGDFTGDGRDDLIAVNRGAHSFSVLTGNGNGGVANPQGALTTSTSDGFSINQRPGAVVTGDFNRDGRQDLAVLMEDTGQLWIYTGDPPHSRFGLPFPLVARRVSEGGDGTGHFNRTFTIQVGDQATGLSVVSGDPVAAGVLPILDLLVGNGFGDVLHLEGRGDGTFQIRGNRVALSVVADLLGPGQAGVLVANQQANRVTVQAPTADMSQFTTVQTITSNDASQMAPGDVEWAILDRNATLPDAVVVSTGNNAVVVYRTIAITGGVPTFAPDPRTYFAGTAPTSLTVADINGDSIADMLIANQGSDDVSVLFGSYDSNGYWLGMPGPRLRSGGAGPIAVAQRDLNGDAIPDLAVTNGGGGTVTMLPGVGQGFFDDRQPRTLFNLGGAVVQPPTFVGDTGVGYAVTAAGDLVRFDLADVVAGARVVFAGEDVLAARALPSGDVVVALAGGTVKVLTGQGDTLTVSAELRTQGSTPIVPSSLEVLQSPGGQLQVLVSSQGSDTIFLFTQAVAGAAPIPGPGNSAQPAPAAAQTSSVLNQVSIALTTDNIRNVLGSAETMSASIVLGPNSAAILAAPLGATNGLALSTLPGGEDLALTPLIALGATLVPVQGSNYSTVAVLDFAPAVENPADAGSERKPGLSTSYPIGDTSPLTRLVTGLDEALQQYQAEEKARLQEQDDPPARDPWLEDLFHRLQPMPEKPMEEPEAGESGSMTEDAAGFWQNYCTDCVAPTTPSMERAGVEFKTLGLLLAGVLLAHAARMENAADRRREFGQA